MSFLYSLTVKFSTHTFFPHIFLEERIFFLGFSQSLLGQCKFFFHERITRRRPIQSRLQISDGCPIGKTNVLLIMSKLYLELLSLRQMSIELFHVIFLVQHSCHAGGVYCVSSGIHRVVATCPQVQRKVNYSLLTIKVFFLSAKSKFLLLIKIGINFNCLPLSINCNRRHWDPGGDPGQWRLHRTVKEPQVHSIHGVHYPFDQSKFSNSRQAFSASKQGGSTL